MRYVPPHATFEMKVCLAVLVLAVFAGVGLLASTRRAQAARAATAAAIVVASATWLRISRPIEGTVIKTIAENHGVTVADLIVIPCLAVAAGLLWVVRRDRAVAQVPVAVDAREQ
ncbi:MAG: hypothetical protein JWM93_1976 [Frankiales bacterium]|nr:hypothetical protein [Frankiales bacterium]